MNGNKNTSPLRCVFNTRNMTPDAYRLPGENSRKWKSQATLRMLLADYLATYANADGSRIETAIKTMATKLGVCPRTISSLLADLGQLGFLTNGTLTGFKGTRRRALNVPNMVAKSDAQDSSVAQDSTPTVAQDSSDTCAGFAGQLRKIDSPVAQDSRPVAQPIGCAQPSVGPRDREPTELTGAPQNAAALADERVSLSGASPQTPATMKNESELAELEKHKPWTDEEYGWLCEEIRWRNSMLDDDDWEFFLCSVGYLNLCEQFLIEWRGFDSATICGEKQ